MRLKGPVVESPQLMTNCHTVAVLVWKGVGKEKKQLEGEKKKPRVFPQGASGSAVNRSYTLINLRRCCR